MDKGAAAPAVELQQVAAERRKKRGNWRVRWRLVNRGAAGLTVLSLRLPHGQFKSAEQRVEPAVVLDAGGQWWFHTEVRCVEPAGHVTENAFVILEVIWSGEPWRIFARISVLVRSDGQLQTKSESITTQRVGFSNVSS